MSILIKHMAMPKGCIYANDKDQTEYCPLLNHDDVPFCQYIENESEIAIGIDERPVYCPLSDVSPCQDTVSRQAAIDAFLTELTKRERKNLLHTWSTVEVKYFVADMLEKLPSVQPYTDEQIQRMQNMEQAQLDKAFELGKLDAQKEIIRCKECRWRKDQSGSTAWLPCRALATPDDFYCERAERGTDETD